MKNKLVKSMTMIIAIAMLVSMVPAVVSAAENISNAAVVINSDGSLTVTADVAASTIDEYTLLAVRAASVYDDTTDLPATDEALEAQIEYIDQPALKDGAVSATFKLRERDGSSYGNIINVLLGGEDTDVAFASVKIKNAAPTLSMTTTEFWADQPVVIDYTENAAWEDEAVVKTVKVDGTEVNATIEGGAITIAAGELAVGTYSKVEVTDAVEDFDAATLETTITVKSRVEAAKAEMYTGITTENTDVNTEDSYEFDTYVVTVPESQPAVSGATITYAVEYDTENANISVSDGVYTITRHAENEISIVVKATISATGETDYVDETGRTYKAAILGADGPSIAEADVVFANWEGDVYTDVYGIDGAKIVEIAKGELNPVNDGLKVGDTVFFYSPVREKYIGVIAGYSDAATLIAAIEVTAVPPVNFYYGYGDDPTHEYWTEGDTIVIDDVMRALQIKNGVGEAPTLLDYIVCDVEQDGEITIDDVMLVLQAKNHIISEFDIEIN